MKEITRHLRNERGNMTIFVLSIFTFMLLVLFTGLFNFSTVFIDKDRAMNIAQQASQAALKDIYTAAENAILLYDSTIALPQGLPPVMAEVELEEMALRISKPDWADSEVHYTAIDNVLGEGMPAELEVLLRAGLLGAEFQVRGAVGKILRDNKATLEGSTVHLNSDNRIEVKTSVRYETEPLGFDFMPKYSEQVYQIGESRQIGFNHSINWAFSGTPF